MTPRPRTPLDEAAELRRQLGAIQQYAPSDCAAEIVWRDGETANEVLAAIGPAFPKLTIFKVGYLERPFDGFSARALCLYGGWYRSAETAVILCGDRSERGHSRVARPPRDARRELRQLRGKP